MSREIKFRAWDKTGKYKVMCQVINLYSGESPFAQLACDFQDGSIYKWRVFTRSLESIELMQYTGLKDKNGKEIYEGDIVRGMVLVEDGSSYESKEEVSWEINTKWHVPEVGFYIPCMKKDTMEVIGNIHETPELRT